MTHFVPLTKTHAQELIISRTRETKFGECLNYIVNFESLEDSIAHLDVDYIIFGISEDIGVYANHGKMGTRKAWQATLKALLNVQNNTFMPSNRVAILGHLDYKIPELGSTTTSNKDKILKARQFVEIIDKDVSHLVHCIVKSNKIPIVVGGGHNNSYGAIKGTALALNQKINVINFDAHTDFRPTEGRHSGNGFSYAYTEGFLRRYFIFGIHENYTSDTVLKTIEKLRHIAYNTYEAIEIRETLQFKTELKIAATQITPKPFGIEIDCDAVKNIPSSAETPSGFSVKQTRQFLNHFATYKQVKYLHICEAAPKKKTEKKVSKLISSLITDFIKIHSLESYGLKNDKIHQIST